MPTPGQNDRPAPATGVRDHVIAVARRQLSADGLASMTMRQVARETGVDPGTVRHYFHTKDDLVRAAVGVDDELVQAYRTTAEEVGQAPGGAGAALVAAAVRHLCNDPAAEVAMSVCVTGGDYEATVFSAFESEVVAAVALRLVPEDGEVLAALAMAAFLGLELLATLLPAVGRPLCEAEMQALLVQSIDGYLKAS